MCNCWESCTIGCAITVLEASYTVLRISVSSLGIAPLLRATSCTRVRHRLCVCVLLQRVHLALAAKKVDAEVIWISLQKKPEWYLEIFPKGEVPLLEQDGKRLAESGVIFGKYFIANNPQLH